jgi:hypothetical protein
MQNQFALNLLDWHNGGGIYAVGSCLLAERWPEFEQMIKARRELIAERTLAQRGHRTEDSKSLKKLIDTLTLMLETRPEYCAAYQRWQESNAR